MVKAIYKASALISFMMLFLMPVSAQNALTALGLTGSNPATAAFSLQQLNFSDSCSFFSSDLNEITVFQEITNDGLEPLNNDSISRIKSISSLVDDLTTNY